jgi:twitching motility two-component system response regulator PilG
LRGPHTGQPGAGQPDDAFDTTVSTTPTIMVIDDSPSVRTIVQASFARVGIPTIAFPDGIEALKALSSQEVPAPDLVLLDIGLPKMDGYEVAQILRSNGGLERTPIIMLTARDHVIDRLRSRMVGARDFIGKPFRVSQLVRQVCEVLQYPLPPAPQTVPPQGDGPPKP